MVDSVAESAPPLNLVFAAKEFKLFVDNLLKGKSEPDVVPFTPTAQETPGAEAECSSTTNLKSAYLNLSPHLKSCLDYCYFIINNSFGCFVKKERLACLLLSEGLIKQDNSNTLKEDVASTVIDQLARLGLLEKCYLFFEWVCIPSSYQTLRTERVDRNYLFAKAPDSAIRLFIVDGTIDNFCPNLYGLTITSLLDHRRWNDNRCISRAFMETICKLKSLVVLDLKGDIECLPDEIGDLVHLKYLRLSYLKLNNELQRDRTGRNVGKDFEMICHMDGLPAEVLDIQRLWHIMINRSTFNYKVGVPMKIGLRLNLHTLTGVYARGGITSELSKFTHLRRLKIYCVSDERATELCAAIMKMPFLLSLSMEAERMTFGKGKEMEVVALFPELEAFSPPPRLQEVELDGQLVDIPTWLSSMENLSILKLCNSNLDDDSVFALQFLPNLKHLHLENASNARQIGEEFCQAGGFPKLETLCIHSTFLVEWIEMASGAFPSLRSLSFFRCRNLIVLPNGLQNISTLDKLRLYHIHGDLERRLQGIEDYKIKNIAKVVFNHIP